MKPDSAFAVFADEVRRVFQPRSIDTFWDCESAFKHLLEGDFVGEAINIELRRLAANPHYLGDWQPKQLMVHRDSGWALSIALFDRPRQYVHTSPYFGLYAPVGKSALNYDLYELPLGYRNEVFDPSMQLRRAGSGAAQPSEVLQIRSQAYAYDFKIAAPVLIVKLTTSPYQPMEWLFNKETLYPWQANDAEVRATQMRVAAYLLGKLAHHSSLEPLEQLTRHPHHAVRWAAIQNIGRLSRQSALEKLNGAIEDEHPHIRRAAQKTLQQMNRKL